MQWTHVDVERATASDLGGTIAHGLFTLSPGPRFTEELTSFAGFSKSLNHGYGRVRFQVRGRQTSGLRRHRPAQALDA
jgi:acyl dehydratase